MTTLLMTLAALLAALLFVPALRRPLLTRPLFAAYKRILPPMSDTEREALEAGDVWWDADLFTGNPDWSKLLAVAPATLETETAVGVATDAVQPATATARPTAPAIRRHL